MIYKMKINMNCIRKYLMLAFTVSFITVHAQVTVGWDTPPEKAALLEIKSQNPPTDGGATSSSGGGGLLLPRVLLTDINELSPFIDKNNVSPTEYGRQKKIYKGLVVYNLTETEAFVPGMYVWDGIQWTSASGDINSDNNEYWALDGNKSTDPAINSLGTNDQKTLIFKTKATERLKINETGNIGINNTDPERVLDVSTDTKLNASLFLKGLQPAPTDEDAPLSILVRDNVTGQVYSAPGPGKSTRSYTFIKYIISNLNRVQGGIKCILNTQISIKDHTLVVVGSSFQTNPAGMGLIVGPNSSGDYNSQSVYAYLDTQSGSGVETWFLSADYPGGRTANGKAGIWTIYCLAIDNSLVKTFPRQFVNMEEHAIWNANPIEGM